MSEAHDRLTELFGEAIGLGETDRAELLERARATDPALADELASLLAADERSPLATGALVPTANLRGTTKRPPAKLEITGYRMLDVLGEGGMGTVYAAEQLSPRRQVAIKVLHGRHESTLARFKTEAQIMARLDHPGIARVLEAGEAAGHPFLVMERVPGVTLDHHVATLSLDARLELFAAICDAVHHAHVKAVIHRDLKPGNVMVKPDGRPVVLDFGIAHLTDDLGTTRAGELVGTPIYMSPEQAQLKAHEVDARSDVYTLGVMLYQLACNELPYETSGLSFAALARTIGEAPPIPLGKRDPALRGDLEAITAKALEKAPSARYPSAAALADDLRLFRANLPVSAWTPGPIERARRFVRRRPLAAAGIAAGVVGAATFATVVTTLWLDARAARRVADEARARIDIAAAGLETRTNQLVLRQARAVLARDPTEALAWLATLTRRDVDPGTAWLIADEALARGVAKDVLRTRVTEDVATLATGDRYSARGSDDGHIEVRDRDGRELALRGHASRIRELELTGSVLRSVDDDGMMRHWELSAIPTTLFDLHAPIDTMATDGAQLAAVDAAGTITRWTIATGGHVQVGKVSGRVTAIALADEVVISGTAEGVVTWSGGPDVARAIHGVVKSIRVSDDLVAVATTAGPIALFTRAGEPLSVLSGNEGGTETIAFDPSGVLLASGGQDRVIGVWRRNGAGFAQVASLQGPHGDTHFVAFSPSGDRLVSAGNDGNVFAWSVRGGVVDEGSRKQIAKHTGQVTALAVSRDWIASAGRDATLVRSHLDVAESKTISAAAKTLALGDDGSVHAVTRTGSAVRWSQSTVATEIDHGLRGAIAVSGTQWILAFENGSLLVSPLPSRPFAELLPTLRRATSYTPASR
ncbi:MAG: serine/threonine protein kinase [Myxococcales bacterium]|nr:serine/threonine protein kinase [Myxococcales bacterium]